MNRLSKNKIRKIHRYVCPQIPRRLLLDFPRELWRSFEVRASDLNITLSEFLQREAVIDKVRALQLTSIDPEVAVDGGNTGRPGPQRIERIFSRLKR